MSKESFRVCAKEVELRVRNDGTILVKGLLPTNSLSDTLYNKQRGVFFQELLSNGVFDDILSRQTPKILLNHSYEKEQKLISFDGSETRNIGLRFEAEIVPTQDLLKNLHNVTGLSFGFICGKQEWEKSYDRMIRKVLSFHSLEEISILYGKNNHPAYSATKIIFAKNKEELNSMEVKAMKNTINQFKVDELKNRIEKLKAKSK